MDLKSVMNLDELNKYCQINDDMVVMENYEECVIVVRTVSNPREFYNKISIYAPSTKIKIPETLVKIATLRCDKTDIGETDEYGDIMFSNVPAFYMAEHFIDFINKFYITEKDVH